MSNEKRTSNQPLYPRLDAQSSSQQPPAYTPPSNNNDTFYRPPQDSKSNNNNNNNLGYTPIQQYGQQQQQQQYEQQQQQAQYVVLPPPQDLNSVGDKPAVVVCPHCKQAVLTVTNHRIGPATFASAAGMLVFGTGVFALAPFFISGVKDVIHSCPSCHKMILKKKRLGGRKIYTSNNQLGRRC